jgi:beta-lactamase class C
MAFLSYFRRSAAAPSLIALAFFACCAVATAQAPTPPPPVVPGQLPAELQRSVLEFEQLSDAMMRTGQVVGFAAAIVKDGKVLSQRGLGTADMASGQPVTPNTVFRLASLSKAFASALTALLVQDAYLSWDDSVQDLVPAFELKDSRQSVRATVRDLLSHRLGLPHNAEDLLLERDEPYPLLVYRLRDLPMVCQVGDCYAYQNVAFALIGDVTFASTGDFFSHQVERRLFHPLGMATATYGRDALEANVDWARPHVKRGRYWTSVRPKETYYRVVPAAGVNASITDMTQWLLAQLGHRPDVLSPEVLSTLHTPLVDTPGEQNSTPWRRARLLDAQYAMGWRIYDYAGHTMVFHAGAVQGYRGMLALLPEYDFGVVMLWNSESAMPSGLMPTLVDRFLGLPAYDWMELSRFPMRPAIAAAGTH